MSLIAIQVKQNKTKGDDYAAHAGIAAFDPAGVDRHLVFNFAAVFRIAVPIATCEASARGDRL